MKKYRILIITFFSFNLFAQDAISEISFKPYIPKFHQDSVGRIIVDHANELYVSYENKTVDEIKKACLACLELPLTISSIALEADTPIGFVNYGFTNAEIVNINMIAIDKKHQRKNYGKKLLQYTLSNIKSHNPSVITLCTGKDNTVAQKLYINAGFKRYMLPNEKNPLVYRYHIENK